MDKKEQPMFCCEEMAYNIQETKVLHYSEVFEEYGIPCQEDGTSVMLIQHCPWCGCKLPPSKREAWFAELEALGFDAPLFDDSIPKKYRSSQWRD